MIDKLDENMQNLATARPFFHSEDDLKLAFAFNLARTSEYEIRLEKPFSIDYVCREENNNKKKQEPSYVDMCLIKDGINIPIEFKYPTSKLEIDYNSEKYCIKEHAARDITKYSVRRDIYRIEQMKKNTYCAVNQGFVILLTNDSNFWLEKPKYEADSETLDKNYRLASCICKEDKGWNYHNIAQDKRINHWTKGKQYNYRYELTKNYNVNWKQYNQDYISNLREPTFDN